MHYRLPQQIPHHQKIGRVVSRKLNHLTKAIFAKYGIPQKLMSDAGTNFVSEKFQ